MIDAEHEKQFGTISASWEDTSCLWDWNNHTCHCNCAHFWEDCQEFAAFSQVNPAGGFKWSGTFLPHGYHGSSVVETDVWQLQHFCLSFSLSDDTTVDFKWLIQMECVVVNEIVLGFSVSYVQNWICSLFDQSGKEVSAIPSDMQMKQFHISFFFPASWLYFMVKWLNSSLEQCCCVWSLSCCLSAFHLEKRWRTFTVNVSSHRTVV